MLVLVRGIVRVRVMVHLLVRGIVRVRVMVHLLERGIVRVRVRVHLLVRGIVRVRVRVHILGYHWSACAGLPVCPISCLTAAPPSCWNTESTARRSSTVIEQQERTDDVAVGSARPHMPRCQGKGPRTLHICNTALVTAYL